MSISWDRKSNPDYYHRNKVLTCDIKHYQCGTLYISCYTNSYQYQHHQLEKLSYSLNCCICLTKAHCLEQTTMPHHMCTEFSAVVWRLALSAIPFPTFLYNPCSDFYNYQTLWSRLLLITYTAHRLSDVSKLRI